MSEDLSAYYLAEEHLNERGFSLKGEPKAWRARGKVVVAEGSDDVCARLQCEAKPRYRVHVWLTEEVVARIYVCADHLEAVKRLAYEGLRVGYKELGG